jgi:hypothetical protein
MTVTYTTSEAHYNTRTYKVKNDEELNRIIIDDILSYNRDFEIFVYNYLIKDATEVEINQYLKENEYYI